MPNFFSIGHSNNKDLRDAQRAAQDTSAGHVASKSRALTHGSNRKN